MNTLKAALNSRTVWTVVLIVLINTLPVVKNSLPPAIATILDAALGALAVYFKLNPSQTYPAK